MAAVSRAPPAPFELRHANPLIATMEAIDDAEKGRGGPDIAELEKAICFLWSDSTNSGQPEITFFDVQSTPGQASIPVNAAAPLTCLSMTWRSNTLLTIAQMLDIGSAQSDFGPPSDWLTLAYQRFGSKVADEPRLPERPKAKPRRVALSLRPNADYLRLAVETMKDPLRRTRHIGGTRPLQGTVAVSTRFAQFRRSPNRKASSMSALTEEGCHFRPPRTGRSPIWSSWPAMSRSDKVGSAMAIAATSFIR